MPPTHFLRVAGQSARDVADDGSTEGGITESLAMMNGEVTKSLMTSSLIINAAGSKNSRLSKSLSSILHACLGLRGEDTKRCVSALDQGLELGDIACPFEFS